MARSLRLFYVFRLLSTSYLYVPVMVAFALSRHLDLLQIVLLNTIYCLTVLLAEVPTGAFADRVGRKNAMMLGALAMVAASLTYASSQSFAGFACAEILAALSMTVCSGADSAYLFDLLHQHGRGADYARRESVASTWHMAGQAVAFAAGGALAMIDPSLPFHATAAVAGVAFVVAAAMERDRHGPGVASSPTPSARQLVRHMRAAFVDVLRAPRLKWVIAYSAVAFVLLRATVFIYQPYLNELGFGLGATGAIFAGAYLVAAVVAHRTPSLRRRLGEPALVWGLLALLALTFVGMAVAGGGLWGLGVLALQAAANGLYSPLVKPMLNHEIAHSGRRATVLSVESMVRRAAFGLFSPAIGQATVSWGVSGGLALCGAFGLVGLGLLYWAQSRSALRLATPEAVPAYARSRPEA
jgi:MFS family permease